MVVNELLVASSGAQPCNPRGRKEEERELSSAVFEACLGWICEVLEIDVCGEERGFREEMTSAELWRTNRSFGCEGQST